MYWLVGNGEKILKFQIGLAVFFIQKWRKKGKKPIYFHIIEKIYKREKKACQYYFWKIPKLIQTHAHFPTTKWTNTLKSSAGGGFYRFWRYGCQIFTFSNDPMSKHFKILRWRRFLHILNYLLGRFSFNSVPVGIVKEENPKYASNRPAAEVFFPFYNSKLFVQLSPTETNDNLSDAQLQIYNYDPT